MLKSSRGILAVSLLWMLLSQRGEAQIDPERRELIQFGYNQPLEGSPPPFSAYAFFYDNIPDFLHNTNLTLRLAIAPTYLDSELGISRLLGPSTDIGIGLAGGGFADSYYEIERGKYLKQESFDGYGSTVSSSVYHLFNPGDRIPLNGILRGDMHFSSYAANDDTASDFRPPGDVTSFDVRGGLRFGGKPPLLTPDMAMELSIWYQGEFRLNPQEYGYAADPYHLNAVSHLFWARALLAYTLPESKQTFMASIIAGDSVDADRFSAYRLGGELPMAAEFPLPIPGYYYQELSATRFFLLNGNYAVPLDPQKRWSLNARASGGMMQYLPGLEQPGHWNSGVGGGLGYMSTSGAWQLMLDYGYGFEAIRSHGRGAQSIGLYMQINLEKSKAASNPDINNGLLRGLQGLMRSFH